MITSQKLSSYFQLSIPTIIDSIHLKDLNKINFIVKKLVKTFSTSSLSSLNSNMTLPELLLIDPTAIKELFTRHKLLLIKATV